MFNSKLGFHPLLRGCFFVNRAYLQNARLLHSLKNEEKQPMYQQRLNGFISRLPDETALLTIRAGTTHQDLVLQHKIAILERGYKNTNDGIEPHGAVDLDDAHEQIEDVLSDLGFGEDFTYVRIHAYTATGGHIRSVSLKATSSGPTQDSFDGNAAEILAKGLVAMASECRRTLATITHTLEQRESVLSNVLNNLIQAKEKQMQAEGEALALQLALETDNNEQSQAVKAKGLDTLQYIANMLMSKGQTITVETVKEAIRNDPSIIKDVASDEDIVDKISEALFSD